MTNNEVFNEIIKNLNGDDIINGAIRDDEKPIGYLLTYIKDEYNIPKKEGWNIAEAILKYFGIKNDID